MSLFAAIYWSVVLALTALGDVIINLIGGEKASYTHYLAIHIPVGVRVALLAWLVYHFLIQHVAGLYG